MFMLLKHYYIYKGKGWWLLLGWNGVNPLGMGGITSLLFTLGLALGFEIGPVPKQFVIQ